MKFNRLLAALLAVLMLLGSSVLAQEEPACPRVSFYIDHYIGHLGRDTSVIVKCATPKLVPKDNNVFELRNHRGEVLDTGKWTNPGNQLTFRFTVPDTALGANELSVWWNGVDVTANHAYAAYSDLSVKRVTQLEPEVPAIALTIVCGGGNSQQVDEVLAVLDKHQVRCTFFFNGGYLEAHTEDAIRITQAGHEIGSHGYQHVHMTQMNSYAKMRKIITKMNERSEELLGVRPRLFRAPYSETNQYVTALCRAEGMEDIHWNIDSRDWSDTYKNKPQQIVKRITGKNAVSGSVIQFHINGYHTADVLDQVIPYYRDECGYQVVTVGELLELSGRELPPLPDIEAAGEESAEAV